MQYNGSDYLKAEYGIETKLKATEPNTNLDGVKLDAISECSAKLDTALKPFARYWYPRGAAEKTAIAIQDVGARAFGICVLLDNLSGFILDGKGTPRLANIKTHLTGEVEKMKKLSSAAFRLPCKRYADEDVMTGLVAAKEGANGLLIELEGLINSI